MLRKIIDIFIAMLAGYLIGIFIGFVVFDPDLGLWGLFGLFFPIVGIRIAFTPFFQRHGVTVMMCIIGAYIGTLLGVILFGYARRDGYAAVLNNAPALVVTLLCILITGIMSRYLPTEKARIPLFVTIVGGIFGGLIFIEVLQISPYASVAGWSPFILFSSIISGGSMLWLQITNRTEESPTL